MLIHGNKLPQIKHKSLLSPPSSLYQGLVMMSEEWWDNVESKIIAYGKLNEQQGIGQASCILNLILSAIITGMTRRVAIQEPRDRILFFWAMVSSCFLGLQFFRYRFSVNQIWIDF